MKDQSRRFVTANIIALIVTVALLLFLFLYPRRYMEEMAAPIVLAAAAAEEAAISADWPEVEARIREIRSRFEAGKNTAKLFLNHEDVDEMDALIGAAERTAQVKDDAELLIHLERIGVTAEYLAGIETFDVTDLL